MQSPSSRPIPLYLLHPLPCPPSYKFFSSDIPSQSISPSHDILSLALYSSPLSIVPLLPLLLTLASKTPSGHPFPSPTYDNSSHPIYLHNHHLHHISRSSSHISHCRTETHLVHMATGSLKANGI